jgi:hypothetical protein
MGPVGIFADEGTGVKKGGSRSLSHGKRSRPELKKVGEIERMMTCVKK